MNTATHSMREIPKGKSVQDMLPAFAGVKNFISIGTRHLQKECACCRKPFTAARRQYQGFRLHPQGGPVAISFEYYICRACYHIYRAGGAKRDSVLAALENFMLG